MPETSSNDPSTIVNPPPQPLLSARRLVILLLMVGAGAFLVYGMSQGRSSGGGTGCVNPVVAAFDPCPGARVLRQAQVGVELEQGYDGRISVNGIEVPEDQMVGAIIPGSEAYETLSPEERQLGPRPNNKNVVKFQPGKGRVVTRFSGEVSVVIRYWKLRDGSNAAETLSYTVFVT